MPISRQLVTACCSLLISAVLAGCAHTPAYEPADPLEPVNRKIYAFNRTADRYILRPIARTYVDVTPQPARSGVHNFLSNLGYPVTIVNALLQGKFAQAGRDTGRFLINTTAGLGGLVDVATPVGLVENDEDFGQTLGYWGVGPGWYLMLPFLGPSTNRGLVGQIADGVSTPERLFEERTQYVLTAVGVIDRRAQLLSADGFLEQQVDEYVALRTVYLESRLNDVYDGTPPLDYGEEDLEDGGFEDDDNWREDFGG
ncbi:VacJ family lipoprotein [Algiphilus sp.]|uniref:MlaA family lipoprotein n=1 Tax=Algiphilus sp. TaxID=1872431 RepID=UPI003B51AB95